MDRPTVYSDLLSQDPTSKDVRPKRLADTNGAALKRNRHMLTRDEFALRGTGSGSNSASSMAQEGHNSRGRLVGKL